ncbi:MAG: class I adenylate-forming enzyme family protein [Deltaproteobacteria bacterium]
MSTVSELFQSSVDRFTGLTAAVEGDTRVTYGDLGRMARNFSSYLLSKGIEKGDRVAIFLPNSVEFVAAFFGAASIGAVSVPINSVFKEEELGFYIEHSSPRILVTEERLKPLAAKCCAMTDTAVRVVKGNNVDWEFSQKSPDYPVDAVISPEDEAIYLYSTGSTGKPKRVARTHYNLTALANNHTDTVGWTEKDRILFTIPISHTYGFGNFISAVKTGAEIVVLAEFNRHSVLDLLDRESITVFPAVPVILDVLAKTFLSEPKDLSSLNLVISAGAPLPKQIFYKFHERFSIYPRQLYGSTETGVISINMAQDIQNRFDSVGRPVRNVEVKLFNEDGVEVRQGETGEIAVKSPSMTTGYYGLPDETTKVFRDGYYFTGDIGRIDGDGFIYILGRKKFFINVGGHKVDPAEVENILSTHPKINESAVLGIKDKNGDERVKAVIVSDDIIESGDVIGFCMGKIAEYKIPQVIEFREKLPRSPTGKVLREKLK